MPVPTSTTLPTADAIDAAIAAATADPYKGVSRLVFQAASSTSPLLYSGKGGIARATPEGEADVPIEENSIFELYSCTKLVGSLAAMQLVEQGRIALDDDASEYVPELKEVKIFKRWDQDKDEPVLEENEEKITVRQLLTHTSGFIYYFQDLENVEKVAKKYGIETAPYGEKVTRDSLYKMPLFHKPGSTWVYGTSIDWLTRIVENVSGLALEAYVQKHIFGPLGITDISYAANPSQIDMAFSDPSNPSAPYKFARNKPFSKQYHYGGAGLNGSAPSYLKLLRAILRGGELDGVRILKPETVDLMFTPQLNEKQAKDLQEHEKNGSEPFTRRAGKSLEDANWGLGGMLSGTGLASGRGAGSLHWSGMANTFWVIDRKKDVCFVLFSNIIPFGDQKVFDAWETVETELYKSLA
ncbi:hypothetical protein JCM11251_000055 [Rhodosporidiobolus azoricus]